MVRHAWVLALVTAVAFLTGCRDTTYTFPADKQKLVESGKVASVDPAWYRGSSEFTSKVFPVAEQGTVLVSPAAIYQILAVLWNSAEGKTYEELAEFLGTEEFDRFDINDAQRAWITENGTQPDAPVFMWHGLWMIWPILVTDKFQSEMARDYHIDIVRLGSAGLNSTKTVNQWAARRSKGTFHEIIGDLTKTQQMISTSMVSVKDEWEKPLETLSTGQLVVKGDYKFELSDKGGVIDIPTKRGLIVRVAWPTDTNDQSLILEGPSQVGRAQVILPSIEFSMRVEASRFLRNRGHDKLFDTTNDFRNLSIEFDRTGVINALWQQIQLSWNERGLGQGKAGPGSGQKTDAMVEPKGMLQVLIMDKATNTAIISGWIVAN